MPVLRNTNPLGAIYLPLIGQELQPGEEFEVTAKQAGRAPSGSDPGDGLLGQAGNYERVETPAQKAAQSQSSESTTEKKGT